MKPNRLTVVVLLALSACAAGPSQLVHDKLDSNTGTTVSVITHPVELLTEGYLGARTDAFAYLAPFEIDQMGARKILLWISVPHDATTSVPPVVVCDKNAISLPLHVGSLGDIGLAQAPYDPPDPWGTQWYFDLPDASLACLAAAHFISVQVPDARSEMQRFSNEGAKNGSGFAELASFAARRGT